MTTSNPIEIYLVVVVKLSDRDCAAFIKLISIPLLPFIGLKISFPNDNIYPVEDIVVADGGNWVYCYSDVFCHNSEETATKNCHDLILLGFDFLPSYSSQLPSWACFAEG